MMKLKTYINQQIVEHTGHDQSSMVDYFERNRSTDELKGFAGFFNYVNNHRHTMTPRDIKVKVIYFLTWARTPSATVGTLTYLEYAKVAS